MKYIFILHLKLYFYINIFIKSNSDERSKAKYNFRCKEIYGLKTLHFFYSYLTNYHSRELLLNSADIPF